MTPCKDSCDSAATPVAGGLSLRSNFAWALTGNVVYGACQWGMIVALAKLGNSIMVGQFALGLAIATPVIMFTNFQLRSVQATDARRQYPFGEYLGLRMVMTLAAIVVIAGITLGGHYARETALVILAVGAAKCLEAMSDVFYGLFQLNDRLDQIGRSMMLRGVLSVMALGAILYLSRDAFWGVAAMAVVWLSVLVFFDVRRGRRLVALSNETVRPRWRLGRQWKLTRLSLPLGIVMTLVSVNLNMPRYFIQSAMGEHRLGVFSAMAYTTLALSTIADAMGQSATPRLSRLYASGNQAGFRSLFLKLILFAAGLGLSGVVVAQVAGARLLTIFYSPEYAAHAQVFVWLMVGAGISCVAYLATNGITAARCFRIQVPMFVLVAGSNALGCVLWVPSAGLAGAAAAVVLAAAVHLATAAAVMGYVLWHGARVSAKKEAGGAAYARWEPSL